MTNLYETDDGQKFTGQKKWTAVLDTSLSEVYDNVREHGMQSAWKKHTNRPANGNYNPNWKDCLLFLEAVTERLPHKLGDPVPSMPFMRHLDFDRTLPTYEQWSMMTEIAKLYQYLAKNLSRKPKWEGPCKGGWLAWLVNNGHVKVSNNNFGTLVDLCKMEQG